MDGTSQSTGQPYHIQLQGSRVNVDVAVGTDAVGQQKGAENLPSTSQKSLSPGRSLVYSVRPGPGSKLHPLHLVPPHTYVNETNYIGMNRIQSFQQQQHYHLTPSSNTAAANHVYPLQVPSEQKGSTYSSPRSSFGSESKGSSPKSSMVMPMTSIPGANPGLLLMPQRFPSPRSSITSFNSLAFERFPQPKPMMPGFQPLPQDAYTAPALPPSYDAHQANLMQRAAQGSSAGVTGAQSVPITVEPFSALPNQLPVNPAAGATSMTKLKGLHYDTVPPKSPGPSDAERKLALLTQKLERDMQIKNKSVSRMNSSTSSKSSSSGLPPPPQYMYHQSIPVTVYTNNPHIPTALPSHVYAYGNGLPASNLSSPNSTRSSISTTPIKTALPMHVTPSPQKAGEEMERKVSELTQNIESQLDDQAEYYGKSDLFLFRGGAWGYSYHNFRVINIDCIQVIKVVASQNVF